MSVCVRVCVCDQCVDLCCCSGVCRYSVSVLLLVPALLLLLVLQRRAQLLDEHRQHLVQRVHHASLQPLGDGRPGVVEAQLLQDVVHADRVDFTARPGDEPGKKSGERKRFCALDGQRSCCRVFFPRHRGDVLASAANLFE